MPKFFMLCFLSLLYFSPLLLREVELQRLLRQSARCGQTEGSGQLHQLYSSCGRAVAAARRQEVLQQPLAGQLNRQ